MLKHLLIATSLSCLLLSQTLQEFKNEQTKGYQTFKKSQEDGFKAYQQEQIKAFNDYKKDLAKFWDNPKLSTKKTWVSYTQDKKTKTDVDFKKETIVVQTIAKSKEEAMQKLQIALAKVVTVDTKTVQDTDPLEKIIAKIKKPTDVVDSKVKAEPILSTVIFNKPPTKSSVKKYVNQHIFSSNIKIKKSKKVKHSNVYSVSVKLPKNSMVKRSKIYYKKIKENSKIQKLPMPLVFAIMHSESNFNPRARSHIPAFGLMQIVPKTAGIDSYNYLYKKKRLVTSSYLYDSSNNIKMGTAYLHILYYRYLRKIKNPDSRLYCTIAAYNTGAGNIAYAFTKKYNMNNAAPIINRMTPKEVYAKLMKDLRWDEPKHYLKKVSKRMSQYKKVYGL